MNTLGLPGMLAPSYHEWQLGEIVWSAISLTCAAHCSSALVPYPPRGLNSRSAAVKTPTGMNCGSQFWAAISVFS